MSRSHVISALFAAFGAAVLLAPSSARAQMQPGGGGFGGPTGPGPQAPKTDGVAEEAPKKLGALPTTPVLPPPKEKRKKLQVFSMEGYFRLRGDWMKQMDLGFDDDEALGGAPFPNPLACRSIASGAACKNSYGAANTRLRMEPVFHLDERSTVHMQVDVLDNLVLGSTPRGYSPTGMPVDNFTDNQEPPQAGLNDVQDSIRVKRAWAEIDAPFGLLKFGRMPWHWGTGMVANAGGPNPIHGAYNLDADFGDTVDRISFSTAIPGTSLNAAIAMDWSQTGPTTNQTGEGQGGPGRQPWDLDNNDDLDSWLLTISNMESPTKVADAIANGDSVLQYGAFLAYRTQDYEQEDIQLGESPDPDAYFARNMTIYQPDLWLHFANDKIDFELEASAVFGSFDAPDAGLSEQASVRQFGGVAKFQYTAMDGDFRLGEQVGFASGDQQDSVVPGQTHFSGYVDYGPGDNELRRFVFDQNYFVDLILFRELLGAVHNAAYNRLSFAYDLTSKFTMSGAGILSMAHKPVSTPGNSALYGVEFDADVGYKSDNFFAGIAYGVYLPFAAMNHPEDTGESGPGFNFGANAGDAGTAQTIQTRLGVTF